MTLRSFFRKRLATIVMIAACSAAMTGQASQSNATPSATVQTLRPSAAVAPAAPTLAEMKAMSASELDEAGDRMRLSKDYLSALDCYREALRKQSDAKYYNKIAITELMLRRPVEAEKAAKKAVRKDKHMAEAWNNLGVAHYLQGAGSHDRGHLQDAVHFYSRALSLNPTNASFHNNMAAALMDMKEYDRGVAEYRKAFELDPEFFERAAENGITARMGSPEDRAQFSFVMARLFASAGDTERALHYLRAALEDGYPKIQDVYHEKEFAAVVKDERFMELMKDRPVAIK
jgi:tetratricopeptide (TPR) repeat protein